MEEHCRKLRKAMRNKNFLRFYYKSYRRHLCEVIPAEYAYNNHRPSDHFSNGNTQRTPKLYDTDMLIEWT